MAVSANHVEISGVLIERKALRYTPAGVPVSEGRLRHESELTEAGKPRLVECEIGVIALGDSAQWLQSAAAGGRMKIIGFLASRSRNSRQPVLHVERIEFLEGNENG
ncbi:primosomal replication protein N [Azospira inquinata]|uniref:primosomal replication protein N n=1 Tax=Azospira inquinata TaxID=2785627 RepID=UPI001E5BCB08|nr:primosomal replication protein N [Azospira inquinata]